MYILAALFPGKSPSTHCTEGSVGPMASLNVCGGEKVSCLHSSPNPEAPASSASRYIPTTLARLPIIIGEMTEFISIKCTFIYQMC